MTGIDGNLLNAQPASTHAVKSVSSSDLHGMEAPDFNSAASMSNPDPIKVSNPVEKASPSGDFKEIDVSLPSAQREPANKNVSSSVVLVPNHLNSNFTTNSTLTGSPSPGQHTNFASQYPHLNQNNLFQELPPIADAGPAQVVNSGSTVTLNGSNSKAENGKIVSYSWEQVPTNAKITLSGVNSPIWKFVAPPVAGDTILRFQLTVTDNVGQSGQDTVNILDKPNLGIHSQINPGIETILTASKNSSLSAGQEANTVVIPSNTKFNSQSLTTATPTLSPPLTPPLTTTGHR
jgi:K319L-like, PKD domain